MILKNVLSVAIFWLDEIFVEDGGRKCWEVWDVISIYLERREEVWDSRLCESRTPLCYELSEDTLAQICKANNSARRLKEEVEVDGGWVSVKLFCY